LSVFGNQLKKKGDRMQNYKIITLPAFRAIGMKWDGSWQVINQLKELIQTVSDRVEELKEVDNPNEQLGLSYHTRPDGFVHYSCFEVSETQTIPFGMLEVKVPELTYLITDHHKGEAIGKTYQNILEWLEKSKYKPYKEPNTNYYDSLPIKFEKYPVDRDLNNPHFKILIPITKK
jgi:predicted transcriptional regulator YdeE